MILSKTKINIYKQLQNANYLLRIYKKKIHIFLNFQKKLQGL